MEHAGQAELALDSKATKWYCRLRFQGSGLGASDLGRRVREFEICGFGFGCGGWGLRVRGADSGSVFGAWELAFRHGRQIILRAKVVRVVQDHVQQMYLMGLVTGAQLLGLWV